MFHSRLFEELILHLAEKYGLDPEDIIEILEAYNELVDQIAEIETYFWN